MIRQAIVMAALNLLSLPQRLGSALIDVFGGGLRGGGIRRAVLGRCQLPVAAGDRQ